MHSLYLSYPQSYPHHLSVTVDNNHGQALTLWEATIPFLPASINEAERPAIRFAALAHQVAESTGEYPPHAMPCSGWRV